MTAARSPLSSLRSLEVSPLTACQRHDLTKIANAAEPVNAWDVAPSSLSRFKREGWVSEVRVRGAAHYVATDIGRAALTWRASRAKAVRIVRPVQTYAIFEKDDGHGYGDTELGRVDATHPELAEREWCKAHGMSRRDVVARPAVDLPTAEEARAEDEPMQRAEAREDVDTDGDDQTGEEG